METFSFLASSEDIKNRTFKDWLSAHYSFGSPLHRYDGELTLGKEQLQYIGVDTKNNNTEFSLIIYKYQIEQIYYGFDDVFKISESRSLGLYWKPIRIKIIENGEEEYFYFITYLQNGYNTKEWFELLKTWLS